MDGAAQQDTERWRGRIVAIYLFGALLLGGGGTPNPETEMALQLLAVAALTGWIFAAPRWYAEMPRAAIALAGIVLLLPLLQLMPLPPELWQAMPGRERVEDVLALKNADQSWLAWTVSPPRTLASFVAIIPPVLLMLATSTLTRNSVPVLLGAIVAAALLGALLGAAQLAGGHGAFRIYAETHDEWVTGFFANRNASVDLFLVGGMAIAALYAYVERTIPRSVFMAGAGVLALAALLTGSRAGIALIPVACIAVWLMLRIDNGQGAINRRRVGWYGLAAVFAASLLALRATGSNRLASIGARFASDDIGRADIWRDTWTAIAAHWPWGSGIGTFAMAVLPHERLDALDPSLPNRAHSELLEFFLEAGIFAPLILAAIGTILVRSALRAWQCPAERDVIIFASATLLLMTLHGLVDYPFRTMALSSLAGVAAGLLLRSARGPQDESKTHARSEEIG
ncbi:O-antigen ligase family protein [Qipengyuania atrilutea]|uniref:O-antigen ligase family protein n=1 Tax=Qipengyuania atrilutea TaxID=2744473 RepID=A0A850GZW1_9SPHN|nr:O-antigen ligase family protein [Actirhodobacter atriluteus]NVD43542.1 O-antigen ligase family protein [Actirhodobacter atriluteus]